MNHDEIAMPHDFNGIPDHNNGHELLEPSDGLDDETLSRLKAISKDSNGHASSRCYSAK